ncbi:isoamyl acetate-hydrolyzing esterase [Mycoemilia scoparia]|uniref:Isoamyl acetate-hydrolyzing esterase n=1 Tax=Mycoemilia scoparia TaxID=417184 RepID=A0A9W8DT08_9FUNG|nr:isoamyl acetate-hydrolyzing esterase [Mycoemilia scoparia]
MGYIPTSSVILWILGVTFVLVFIRDFRTSRKLKPVNEGYRPRISFFNKINAPLIVPPIKAETSNVSPKDNNNNKKDQKEQQRVLDSSEIQDQELHQQGTIILFGDSLVENSWKYELGGFGARLADIYRRKLDVVNRGYSGCNTDQAEKILKKILPTGKHRFRNVVDKQHQQIDIQDQAQAQQRQANDAKTKTTKLIEALIIFFGTNDAKVDPSKPGGRSVVVKHYVFNIIKMVDLIKNQDSPYYSPDTKIILIGPPPVNDKQFAKHRAELGKTPNRFNNVVKEYSDALIDLGKSLNLPTIDLWSKITMASQNLYGQEKDQDGNDPGLDNFFTDGIHLNYLGNSIVFDSLMKALEMVDSSLVANDMKMAFEDLLG